MHATYDRSHKMPTKLTRVMMRLNENPTKYWSVTTEAKWQTRTDCRAFCYDESKKHLYCVLQPIAGLKTNKISS